MMMVGGPRDFVGGDQAAANLQRLADLADARYTNHGGGRTNQDAMLDNLNYDP
jgi:hypothetical protein